MLVAGNFHIPVKKYIHDPHQRVEPVDTECQNADQFCERVTAANMNVLMCQDIL